MPILLHRIKKESKMRLLFLAAQNYRNLLYLKNLSSMYLDMTPIHYLDRNHLSKQEENCMGQSHNKCNSQREGRRRF